MQSLKKKIFNELLYPKEENLTATQNVYNNFLMQLVITSAEKLNLYNVCNEENWNSIINSDIREVLLNEGYVVTDAVEGSIGEAAVISFKDGNHGESVRLEDNVLVIEMSEQDGIEFITKTVGEIRSLIGEIHIEGAKEMMIRILKKKTMLQIKMKFIKRHQQMIIKVMLNSMKQILM